MLLQLSWASCLRHSERDAHCFACCCCLPGCPNASLEAIRFSQEQVEEWNGAGYWHLETDRTPESLNAWLVFADPFSVDAETWLRQWNDAYEAEDPDHERHPSGRLNRKPK